MKTSEPVWELTKMQSLKNEIELSLGLHKLTKKNLLSPVERDIVNNYFIFHTRLFALKIRELNLCYLIIPHQAKIDNCKFKS